MSKRESMLYKRKEIMIWILLFSSLLPFLIKDAVATANIDTPRFNDAFLRGGQSIDLERFLAQGAILPGRYRIEIFINTQLLTTDEIDFAQLDEEIQPCLTSSLLDTVGMKETVISTLPVFDGYPMSCLNINDVEYLTWHYDAGRQSLHLSIPQVMLKHRHSSGYVAPTQWDQGITAGFINYNIQSRFDHRDMVGDTTSHYIGLSSGMNIGAWRLRNQGSLNVIDDNHYWQSDRTVAERDLTSWKSQLGVGQIYARSEVFDSPALIGVQVRSEESMLPDELRGYSPVITGMAESNATIEIRQGGSLILKTTVAPGPFELRDIPTHGSNGDLEITVIEANGNRKVRTQGFGMLPVMVREGVGRYQFSLGQLDNHQLSPSGGYYFSADGAYGLLPELTVYGGLQGIEKYYAINAGMGIGTGLGSFSLDVTHADSKTEVSHYQGQSYRFRFGRVFHDAGTTLALAGYRYATEDYRTLNDHMLDSSATIQHSWARVRKDLSLSLTQQLPGNYGGMNLAAGEQEYWHNSLRTRSLSINYGHRIGKLSFQVGAERRYSDSQDQTQLTLYGSYPLSWGRGNHTLTYNSSYIGQKERGKGHNQTIGLAGGWNNHNYSFNVSQQQDNTTWSASSQLRSAFGDGSVGYSRGSGYQSATLHWAGAIVAHAGGVNMAPTLYNGAILAEVSGLDDAANIGFDNTLTTTGHNGVAVLNNVASYRRNVVSVNSHSLPEGVELTSNQSQVVPRRGAIVHTKITARKVNRVQFTLLDIRGTSYPFGTQLLSSEGTLLAIADPHGRVLVLLDKIEGQLEIVSGSDRCMVPYKVQNEAEGNYLEATLQCR
ncbi:fimbria/pilus outer membrane usher protein [Vibrio cholerae]|uniref:fimbria/pilus outer membrane usher protein n=2 Tax=Vibrio cholerae TaxID=666 RepID=UPI0011D91D69|nr:fimbria/pilus outer membrane usher protein [Vibrio cholerae]EJL6306978.1 fimbrial biogenesis outer membrane usher protein [Vibrio cholerae]TXY21795.1 fimbrial biogenesis outer membrane usher protein [Vibrio cholerae]GHX76886.1 fimbrial protein [Vibrio cholerae]